MMAPDTFLEINDGRRDRADVYVEWDRAWTSAWTSQVGVRSDTVMMDTGKVHGYNAMYDAPPLFPATTFNDADRSRVDPNWDVTAQAVYRPDLTETYSFGYSRKTPVAQSLRALLLVAGYDGRGDDRLVRRRQLLYRQSRS